MTSPRDDPLREETEARAAKGWFGGARPFTYEGTLVLNWEEVRVDSACRFGVQLGEKLSGTSKAAAIHTPIIRPSRVHITQKPNFSEREFL